MKIFSTILLTGLFLFNSIGYYLLFSFMIIKQEEVMDKLLAESEKDSFSVIVINLSEDHNFTQVSEREFFYKGNLYDIKSKEIKDGRIIYHCKKDEKELELLNHLCRMNDENRSGSSKNPLNRFLQKSMQNLFFSNQQNSNLLFKQKEPFFEFVSIHYQQPDIFKLTPPPQNYFS